MTVSGEVSSEQQTGAERCGYERGQYDGLRIALKAIDGHHLNDTAHDRIRALLVCSECGHQPDKHGADGCCTEWTMVKAHGWRCQCAEYEFTAKGSSDG